MDVLVPVAAQHEAEGEERPVRPGEAALGVRRGLEIVARPEVFPARAARVERRTAVGALGDFAALFRVEARNVRRVRANGGVLAAEFFYEMIEVIEQRNEVAFSAEKTRDAADADQPAGVADGADDVVGLAAEMLMDAAASGVARDHRPGRKPIQVIKIQM